MVATGGGPGWPRARAPKWYAPKLWYNVVQCGTKVVFSAPKYCHSAVVLCPVPCPDPSVSFFTKSGTCMRHAQSRTCTMSFHIVPFFTMQQPNSGIPRHSCDMPSVLCRLPNVVSFRCSTNRGCVILSLVPRCPFELFSPPCGIMPCNARIQDADFSNPSNNPRGSLS